MKIITQEFIAVYFQHQVNDPSLNINHHRHHHPFYRDVLDAHQNQDLVEHEINENCDHAKNKYTFVKTL